MRECFLVAFCFSLSHSLSLCCRKNKEIQNFSLLLSLLSSHPSLFSPFSLLLSSSFLFHVGGCTVQAIGFNDNYAKFADKGYAVFGISADSPTTQVSFFFHFFLGASLSSLPTPWFS